MVWLGCANHTGLVFIPATDATPPRAALNTELAGHSVQLGMGGETQRLELLPKDSLVLIALGEDPDGGVRDLALSGNALVMCKDMRTGKLRSRATGFVRMNVPGSSAQKTGLPKRTQRFVLRAGDLAALCKGPDQAFAGAVGQATVRAVNYRGGYASSARLEFRLAGGWMTDGANRYGAAPKPVVTSDIPKPVGFMPVHRPAGSGLTAGAPDPLDPMDPMDPSDPEYCPQGAAPFDTSCP